jgi:hypothetical protein
MASADFSAVTVSLSGRLGWNRKVSIRGQYQLTGSEGAAPAESSFVSESLPCCRPLMCRECGHPISDIEQA